MQPEKEKKKWGHLRNSSSDCRGGEREREKDQIEDGRGSFASFLTTCLLVQGAQ